MPLFYISVCLFQMVVKLFHFFKDFIYLFLEIGERKEKERKTSMCGCLSCAPYRGPGPQPRHVPWLGIEPVTLWFTGQHSIHWATLARAVCLFLIITWATGLGGLYSILMLEGNGVQEELHCFCLANYDSRICVP